MGGTMNDSITNDSINYGKLMHQAMRGLLANVLRDVAKNGLPGQHHFFITFETNAEGVDLPDWLREQYPDDMTIVMQEWFAGLEVDDNGFSITLNFGDTKVAMYIPFDAIRTFVDPSVEFGLRFEATEDEGEGEDGDEGAQDGGPDGAQDTSGDTPDAPPEKGDAEVVSLDKFRK